MTRKLKIQIASVWAAAFVLLGSVTAYAAYNTIGINLVRQAKSKWCWAACLEMSSHYLGYSTYDQWDIVKNVKGNFINPYPNESGLKEDYEKGMKFATNGDYTANRTSGVITISSMNAYMNSHVPLIISIGTYKNGERDSGHAVVVCAVDTANKKFKVKDPEVDRDVTYSYSTITSSSESKRWDHTVKIY